MTTGRAKEALPCSFSRCMTAASLPGRFVLGQPLQGTEPRFFVDAEGCPCACFLEQATLSSHFVIICIVKKLNTKYVLTFFCTFGQARHPVFPRQQLFFSE